MEPSRWDKSHPQFGERVRAALARRATKRHAVEKALSKKRVTVNLKAHPGETLSVLPSTAKGLEKIRQIAREGSSDLHPQQQHHDEVDDKFNIVILQDPENEIQARLGVEFHKPRYRLSWRIAQRLRMDEKQVEQVLSLVPKIWPAITREKKQIERLVRDIYVGKIQKVQRERQHAREAKAAQPQKEKRRRADNTPVMTEL